MKKAIALKLALLICKNKVNLQDSVQTHCKLQSANPHAISKRVPGVQEALRNHCLLLTMKYKMCYQNHQVSTSNVVIQSIRLQKEMWRKKIRKPEREIWERRDQVCTNSRWPTQMRSMNEDGGAFQQIEWPPWANWTLTLWKGCLHGGNAFQSPSRWLTNELGSSLSWSWGLPVLDTPHEWQETPAATSASPYPRGAAH